VRNWHETWFVVKTRNGFYDSKLHVRYPMLSCAQAISIATVTCLPSRTRRGREMGATTCSPATVTTTRHSEWFFCAFIFMNMCLKWYENIRQLASRGMGRLQRHLRQRFPKTQGGLHGHGVSESHVHFLSKLWMWKWAYLK